MKTSNEVNEIFKAQIALQAELENIAKDSKGYGYNYTSLEKLIAYVKPKLAKHGMGFIQTNTTTEDGKIGVTTRLIHESGQWVEDTLVANLVPLAKMNEYQVAGSVITYFRRYGLASILGIASDEDIDVAVQQVINRQQLQQLTQMIADTNSDLSKFNQAFNIATLAELPLNEFNRALKMLQAKLNKSKG